MLDHVFITVKKLDRSIAFYETALKPLGIAHVLDYDGKDGPVGHPSWTTQSLGLRISAPPRKLSL